MRISPLAFVLTSSVVLAALLALVWHGAERRWSPPEPLAPGAESMVPLQYTQIVPDPDHYREQVARPLFVPGRRPVAGAAPIREEPPLEMILVGLFGAEGEHRGAIVSTDDGVKRVAVGQRIGTLTLQGIDGMTAVFSDGARARVLTLKPLPRTQPAEVSQRNGSSASAPVPEPPAPRPTRERARR